MQVILTPVGVHTYTFAVSFETINKAHIFGLTKFFANTCFFYTYRVLLSINAVLYFILFLLKLYEL